MLIVALKNRYKAPAMLARLGLVRSSHVYHCACITLENRYLTLRHAWKETL